MWFEHLMLERWIYVLVVETLRIDVDEKYKPKIIVCMSLLECITMPWKCKLNCKWKALNLQLNETSK